MYLGCVKGQCVEPNVCSCNFGYVGSNCTIQCECNGHSDCAGPDQLTDCLSCKNNTQGSQCQRCKPLYVGDPVNNGPCVPCSDYCSGHAHICIDKFDTESYKTLGILSDPKNIIMSNNGPLSDAYCVNCMDNTTGPTCSGCMLGHFRGSTDLRDSCRQVSNA